MRIIYYFSILVFWTIPICASSQENSIQVIHTEQGFISEITMEAGLTIYQLSKQFACSPEKILQSNPDISLYNIQVGDLIRVPVSRESIRQHSKSKKIIPVYYKVLPQENMFRIARVYLGVKEEILMLLNSKLNTELHIGEQLLIGYFDPDSADEPEQPEEPLTASVDLMKEKFETKEAVKTYKNQTGVALWFKDTDPGSGMFVLHESAPINSVVAITNPMFNKTVYAKVIGHIPAWTYPKEVIVVVSPQVAKSLGVLDARFFAKIRVEVGTNE